MSLGRNLRVKSKVCLCQDEPSACCSGLATAWKEGGHQCWMIHGGILVTVRSELLQKIC